jgi:hypothetical protein
MKSFINDWMGVIIAFAYGAVAIAAVAYLLDFMLGTRLVDWLSHSSAGVGILLVSGTLVVTYLIRKGEIGKG